MTGKLCRVRRAEEVSEETVQGQQHLVEDAGHVRRGGRPEEDVRATVKPPLRTPEVTAVPTNYSRRLLLRYNIIIL